jgi:hypothetical protein
MNPEVYRECRWMPPSLLTLFLILRTESEQGQQCIFASVIKAAIHLFWKLKASSENSDEFPYRNTRTLLGIAACQLRIEELLKTLELAPAEIDFFWGLLKLSGTSCLNQRPRRYQ